MSLGIKLLKGKPYQRKLFLRYGDLHDKGVPVVVGVHVCSLTTCENVLEIGLKGVRIMEEINYFS